MSQPTIIHPTATIAPGVELGVGVEIGAYVVIESDVTIGDYTRIEPAAQIKRYTRLGVRNRIHGQAMVGGEPQDLKFQGEVTWLEIGDENNIREFATLHRGTAGGGGVTRIGSRNLCMAYTHVAHDCILGNDIVMSNAATLAGHVQVGDHVIIGGLSAVHQFCRIGSHAFIGGMSGVPQDVPPWMLVAGSRAVVHGPNLVGFRRAKMGSEVVNAFKQVFKLIWKSEIPRSEALERLKKDFSSIPQVVDFIDFVSKSDRGICQIGKKVNLGLDED